MRDILPGLASWFERDEPFVLATVVRTWKSSPREPGASMAVSAGGEVIGSVSGGCVEGALYEIAQDVLVDGVARTEIFRVTDDDAFGVGLTCGGTLEVFVQRVDRESYPEFAQVARAVDAGEPVAVITDRRGAAPTHTVLTPGDAAAGSVEAETLQILTAGNSVVYVADGDEDAAVVEIYAPRPRLYVFGAIDFASALCTLGRFAGYHVTVVDARPVFATKARFPDADALEVIWPHVFLDSAPVDSTTVIAVLTHDEKFDIPLLQRALRCGAGYVGAMGSRATHERRVALLREAGVTESELALLHSPIGLDLGARTPEETAVSILAEVLAVTRGGSGMSLSRSDGPIHRGRADRLSRPADCPVVDGAPAAF